MRTAYDLDGGAAEFGVAKTAIKAAIKAGRLKAKRQPLADGKPNNSLRGGHLVVTHDALVAWLDGWPDA